MLQQTLHLSECKQEVATSTILGRTEKAVLDAAIYVYINNNKQTIKASKYLAEIAPILRNFLVWKFCRKTFFTESWAYCQKNYRNCAFPKHFCTRKLGEISVFYAVVENDIVACRQ